MQNVLILGSKGMLGGQLMKLFPESTGWDREDIDVTMFDYFSAKVKSLSPKPAAIINCVAFNDVDGAEAKKDLAFALNAEFAGKLAGLASQLDIPVVHFSTNYVFDGDKGEYSEEDRPLPLSVYGQTKYEGERLFQKHAGKHYLVRTAVLFGPKGESDASKKSFVDLMLTLGETSHEIKAVKDEVNSVTYAPDLAVAVKRLLEENYPYGIYHVTNEGSASWYNFAHEIFSIIRKPMNILPVPSSHFKRPAQRPLKAVLLNTKFPKLRPWQEALKEYLLNGR